MKSGAAPTSPGSSPHGTALIRLVGAVPAGPPNPLTAKPHAGAPVTVPSIHHDDGLDPVSTRGGSSSATLNGAARMTLANG